MNSKKNIVESRKKQFHRRTQSNSDFTTNPSSLLHISESNPLLRNSLPPENKEQSPKKTNEKQVIIETLDPTPQEQLKMAGSSSYVGTNANGYFKFGLKRPVNELPKFMELMGFSQNNEEEKLMNQEERQSNGNCGKINEESMETESEVSKRSSICRLSINKAKNSSFLKSDIIEEIQEILLKPDNSNHYDKIYRKKGHSKSCFSFNLQAFNQKLKNLFDNKKSISIKKVDYFPSDNSKHSSLTNSMLNISNFNSGSHNKGLRKKSDECLMINKNNSSLLKHKKTSTSIFNPNKPIDMKPCKTDNKKIYIEKIQHFENKIKELEKHISILHEKTDNLENQNKSLSCQIITARTENENYAKEKEEYHLIIKQLEQRIKSNENNIYKVLTIMGQGKNETTLFSDIINDSASSSIIDSPEIKCVKKIINQKSESLDLELKDNIFSIKNHPYFYKK